MYALSIPSILSKDREGYLPNKSINLIHVGSGRGDDSQNDLGKAHLAVWVKSLEVRMDNSANLIFMALKVNNCVLLAITCNLVRHVSRGTDDQYQTKHTR